MRQIVYILTISNIMKHVHMDYNINNIRIYNVSLFNKGLNSKKSFFYHSIETKIRIGLYHCHYIIPIIVLL